MSARDVAVPVYVCGDCDARPQREVLTLGFARPHKCDACGDTKESTELVWEFELSGEVREKATGGRRARMAGTP